MQGPSSDPPAGGVVVQLSGPDLMRRIGVGAVREAIARAFQELRDGTLQAPLRQTVTSPGGATLLMPAWSRRSIGVKILHIRPDNRGRGLPTISGEMLVSDLPSGRLLAVIDAPVLTALRTGGLSGFASRFLAPADSELAALIGSGFQAPFQARAMVEACPSIRRLRIFSRTPAHVTAVAAMLRADLPDVRVEVAASVAQAVHGATLITTATSSAEPFLERSMLGAEVHVNAIGAYTAEMAEVAPNVLASADRIYVDTVAGCREEAGDLIQAAATGVPIWSKVRELGQMTGRRQGNTVFKSVGSAAFDLTVAEAILGLH